MLGDTFGRVLRIVKEWTPKKEYRKESGYRDDLIAHIRKELKRGGFLGVPERHRIRKESGRHLADIGIDENIGIELKRNLTGQSSLDRLIGQIRRFMRSYSYIIVVLCGKTSEGILDDLRHEFSQYSGAGLLQPQTLIEIVRKETMSEREKQPKKRQPKGWVDLFEEITK